MRLFGELCKGSEEGQPFCLRAKMDMTSLNGTMRDPVMYRFNGMSHGLFSAAVLSTDVFLGHKYCIEVPHVGGTIVAMVMCGMFVG